MTIHAAAAADVEALAAIHASAFAAPWSAAELSAVMTMPGAFALFDQIDSAMAGFIVCRRAVDEAEILILATHPEARRKGVARRLLRAACQLAATGGARTLFLEVARDNLAALALYEAEQFQEVARRKGYYARPGGPIDALVLRRSLNTATP